MTAHGATARMDERSREEAINEAKLEQLLSEKLMKGYILLDSSCPVCPTPLVVKYRQSIPENVSSSSSDSFEDGKSSRNVLLPKESFDQPFRPVDGVPICVSCQSHVITQETEVSILEQCDSLKDKGSILVALNEMKKFDSIDEEEDESAGATDTSPEIINLEDINEEEVFMDAREESVEEEEEEHSVESKSRSHLRVDIQAVDCESVDGQSCIEILSSPINRDKDEDDDDNELKPVSEAHIFVNEDETKEIVEDQNQSHQEPIFVEDPAYLNDEKPSKESKLVVDSKKINDVDGKCKMKDHKEEEEEGMDEYSVRREIATKVLGAKMLQGYTLKEVTCDICAMPLMDFKGEVNCVVCPVLEKKAKKKLKREQKMLEHLEQERIKMEENVKHEKEALESLRAEISSEKKRLGVLEQQSTAIQRQASRDEEEEEIERGQERQRRIAEDRVRIYALEKEEEYRLKELEEEEARLLQEARERARVLIEQEEMEEMAKLETIKKEEDKKRTGFEAQGEREQIAADKEVTERTKQQEEEEKVLQEESKKIGAVDENIASDKQLASKAALDENVVDPVDQREREELEVRQIEENRRREEEERILAALEAEAAERALAAEAAIHKAKAALEEVHSTKKEIISKSIAKAEKEAVAETEKVISAQCEDYKEKVIVPSAAEANKEQWATLRIEGRAILTRRILQGWDITPRGCKGAECHFSPLLIRNGKTECVVCGGSGNGLDGVYIGISRNNEKVEDDIDSNENLEKTRELATREVAKRLAEGWVVVDRSCPKCVVPLMTDNQNNKNFCVICGPIDFDISPTIATKDIRETMPSQNLSTETDVKTLEKEVEERAYSAQKAIERAKAALAMKDLSETESDISNGDIEEEQTHEREEDVSEGSSNTRKNGIEEYPISECANNVPIESEDTISKVEDSTADPTVETVEETEETPAASQQPAAAVDSSNDFSYIVERGIGNNAVRNDPPAFTSNVVSSLNPTPKDAPNSFTENETLTVDQEQEEVILHPRQVDLADSAMIKLETNDGNEMNDEEACVADDLTTEMIVNMFLRSKHGFDLHDKADSLSLNDVKERVDLYVLTHMDSSVSDDFKFKVADRVVYKIRSSESKSTETIVNMFLKSPHGYDLYQSDNKSSISNVKERVDIFVVTNMDSEVSDDFKMKVAQRIVDKVTHDEVIHLEHMNSTGSEFVPSSTQEVSATTTTGASPSPTLTIEECRDRLMDPSITLEEQIKLTSMLEKLADSPAATQSYLPQTQPKQSISFDFSENDIDQSTTNQRRKAPRPEQMSNRPSKPPLSPAPVQFAKYRNRKNTIMVSSVPKSPRRRETSDDNSVGGASRCSTVASEALESIYEKIEACKQKLVDPSNNLDEQLATAALLEKLATAAVAVKEMERIDDM